MIDSVQALGDTVKRARDKLSRTQCDVANAMDVDVRTIINIENYRGNPKFEMLFSLIRTLKIDANEIFYPELNRTSPQLNKLHSLIGKCNEEEAALVSVALGIVAGGGNTPRALCVDFAQELEVHLVADSEVVASVPKIKSASALITVGWHDESAAVALGEWKETIWDGQRQGHVTHHEMGRTKHHVLARAHLCSR